MDPSIQFTSLDPTLGTVFKHEDLMEMNQNLDAVITSIYNIILLAGTVYLVGFLNWNPWWFALTLCLLGTWGKARKEENE
jgi:mannose/fructose/N-acetylgalactosamine-specific phosphotransferase system component IID